MAKTVTVQKNAISKAIAADSGRLLESLKPKQAPKVPTPEGNQQEAGAEAQGFALAQSAIGEARGASNTWIRYVARLYSMSPDARGFFKTNIDKHLREMSKHVKAQKGTSEHVIYQRAMASAKVRLSELSTITKALNAGYAPAVLVGDDGRTLVKDAQGLVQFKEAFYTVVSEARAHLESEGSGSKAGRKRDPFVVALVKWIDAKDAAPTDEKKKKDMLHLIADKYPEEYAAATAKK